MRYFIKLKSLKEINKYLINNGSSKYSKSTGIHWLKEMDCHAGKVFPAEKSYIEAAYIGTVGKNTFHYAYEWIESIEMESTEEELTALIFAQLAELSGIEV